MCQFDMNMRNLIYKCIVDTWNWQSRYFVTFGQAFRWISLYRTVSVFPPVTTNMHTLGTSN